MHELNEIKLNTIVLCIAFFTEIADCILSIIIFGEVGKHFHHETVQLISLDFVYLFLRAFSWRKIS